MKNITKAGFLAFVSAVLFSSQFALGQVPNVHVGDRIIFADGPGASPGGAFVLTAYNSTGTVIRGSFESFCVETNETMSFGPSFYVAGISGEARNGGSGGSIATPYPHDPLGAATAWLYTQYIESPSALNSVTGWSSASAVNRGTAMQQAIWRLEGETLYITANTLADRLIAAANASGWTDTGRVHILNLVNSGGGRAQDQLYISPVPEPEIYALLASGLGLMGFVARRRKRSLAAVVA